MQKAAFAKLVALTRVEWRLRQQSTFLGFLWTLLHPALMFAVLYGLFVRWLGRAQADYAVFLLVGIVEWNFFASASSYALSSLLRRGHLVSNYPLPYELPVAASLLSVYLSHLLELAAMCALLAAFGPAPSLSWLWLPALDLACLLLAAGAGLALAPLYVLYSDIERIWSILLTAGFFLTPVFYPLSALPPARASLLALNPLAALIGGARAAAAGSAPPAADLLILLVWSAAVPAAGLAALRLARRRVEDAL